MNKRLRLIIKGKVQKAGYRCTVEEIADRLGITGFIRNLKDGTVEVLAEGEEGKLKDFISAIKIDEFPIRVTEIIEKEESYKGEFSFFEKIESDNLVELTKATLEKADDGAKYMRLLANEMKGTHGEMKAMRTDLTGEMKGMRGEMRGMRTDLTNETKSFHKDTIGRFDKLDDKYGNISKTMRGMQKTVEKSFIEYKKSNDNLAKTLTKVVDFVKNK